MAADPTTGDIYGCFYDETGGNCYFAKVNFEEMSYQQIARLYAPWIGCAFDTDGTLYCVDADGAFCKVDLKTGQTTPINYFTGITSYFPSSAAIDPATHIMYCSAATETTGRLYALDLKSGEATLVEDLPYSEELVGLAFPVEIDGEAPNKISNVQLTFEGGALTGTVSFTAPTTMATGDAGTGALEYVITVDGQEVATAPMTWGEKVSVPLTIAEAGQHTVGVASRIGTHLGQKAEVSQYIGNDTPQAPQITLTRNAGTNILTWTLPAVGTHGGYVDAAATTYALTRLTDNKVLADALSATTYTDEVPETADIVTYAYSLTATYDGRTSEACTTDNLYVGHIVPPYLQTFDTEASLAGWTVIDYNDDTMRWMWKDIDGGIVRMNYRNQYYMDDYLFTPALSLEGGKAYRMTFDVDAHKAGNVERLEVKLATAPTVEAITETLLEPTDVPYTAEYQTMTVTLTPETTGMYYVAFHGISKPAQYYLKLDNVAISDALPTTLPAAPTSMTVVPDYGGRLQAHITLTAPTLDIAGQPLTDLTRIELRRGTTLIHTFDTPAGQLTYDDTTVPEAGRYTYTATAYNAQGEGMTASQQAYVGANTPAPVSNLTATETSEGVVTLTWDAPTTDVDGQPLNPALLTYAVANVTTGTPAIVQDGLKETTTTLQPLFATEQGFVAYAVFAVTDGGMSNGIAADVLPVGKPYTLPFDETFASGNIDHDIALSWNDPAHKAQWMTLTDDDLDGTGVTAPDEDCGILGMTGGLDDEATIWTGKIDLSNTVNPVFSFQTYKMYIDETPSWNFFTIEVKCDGKTEKIEEGLCVGDIEGSDNDWCTADFSLKKYCGKVIQLGLTACVQTYVWTFVDCLHVDDDGNAITQITTDNAHSHSYYDLQGRRTDAKRKGVYITNRRCVVR